MHHLTYFDHNKYFLRHDGGIIHQIVVLKRYVNRITSDFIPRIDITTY